MSNMYKKMFLVTYEKDRGILFANTLRQAQALKRFLHMRGTLTEIDSSYGLELVRVLGGYNLIRETNELLTALRKG